MSKPKTYPPYKLEGEGDEAWIVDTYGNTVVNSVTMTIHYREAIPDIMTILCDALNERERKEGA